MSPTLLLIEDNESLGVALEKLVASHGGQGNNADLTLSAPQPPDRVVLDLNLASEDERRLLTELLCKTPQLRVVIAGRSGAVACEVPSMPLSVERLEWEHIQRVLKQYQGNISATARALHMHRRTLQRKLQKPPTPEQTAC